MKYINIINFITISVLVLDLAIEAYPQRGPRRGGCGLRGRKLGVKVRNMKMKFNTGGNSAKLLSSNK